MSKITALETKELTLFFHEETKIVHHELHRYPGAATLEAALEKGLSLLRERGASKWLSDNRNGGALPKSHHEWAETDWGPRAAKAGWEYWALIPPKETLGRVNMARLKEIYAKLGVKVAVFETPREGMAWLLRCESASHTV
jgi:hypothetical protein